MLAMSIPRSRLFPALLVFLGAALIVISPAIIGCLIKPPALLAAEPAQAQAQAPTPAATRTAESMHLRSPNGKFEIVLAATDEGASVTLSEGDRKVQLHLTATTGNMFLRSGNCTYAATSSPSYAASTVGHAATGRMNTAYCSQREDRVESAFACYVLGKGVTSANAALYADDNGVGKMQLVRGKSHVTIDCPEDNQPAGDLFKGDDPKETIGRDNKPAGFVYLD